MFYSDFVLRRRMMAIAIVMCLASADALAAFSGLVPLSWSGQVTYSYGYSDSDGNESEATSLLLGMNATGYIWRPWFATTSLALNVGLTNTETSSSSSDSTVGTGSFSLGVFPGSRFPFSMNYSRTDSDTTSFQDVSQSSGDTSFTVTRLTLRQSYRPRSQGQLFNAWYYLTDFSGEGLESDTTTYGVDHSLRFSHHSIMTTATHTELSNSSSSSEPSVGVVTVSHVYTPSVELGVSNLASYVEVDTGDNGITSTDSQVFSSFFWRPEHRAVNVSGGARLTEGTSDGNNSFVTRSLNTNVAVGYRITRALNMSANATLGTTDSDNTQTLTTTQSASVSYSGDRQEVFGFSYGWQWGGGLSNSNTRTEVLGDTRRTDQQSVSSGLGHNLGKAWGGGQIGSLSVNFSQSLSGSKSSENDSVSKSLNHGASLSWSRRSGRGSTYVSSRLNDSRSYGERDTVYDDFGVSAVTDYTINRLSSVSGNLDFSASEGETENEAGVDITSGTRVMSGGMAYRNSRPFGIYNLHFSSDVSGSKQLDSDRPSTILHWNSIFDYSLGLLTTSLSFRVTETASGTVSKSMNFQATRSF